MVIVISFAQEHKTSPNDYASTLNPNRSKLKCSTIWVARAGRFICLFRRETRQRIFGPEISPYPEVVRGRERELAGQRSWQRVGDGTAERRVSRRVGVEPRTDAVDSGDSRTQDRVQRRRLSQKMLAFQLLVEFSLVTHASVSPHMHVVLHTSFCSWLTPSFVRVCSSVLFSPVTPDRILVVARNVCYPPLEPLVDHRPA